MDHRGALPGVQVVHAELGAAEPTTNPLADMLLTCHGPREVLEELLSDEDRVAALLAVVHAHKGSELNAKQVVLRADRDLRGELGDAIGAALELARRL